MTGSGILNDESIGESNPIDSLIQNEAEIVRLIQKDVSMINDNGNGNDIHQIINEDKLIKQEFEQILQRFHDHGKKHDQECLEDEEDLFDRDEHMKKNNERTALSGEEEEVVPPENFSHVAGEIYRSSFPRVENFQFLRTRLKLRSILVLIPEDYPAENKDFLDRSGIKLFQVGMSGNKEPFVNIPSDLLTKALEIVLNPENQPILIHCNRGKHRTGCLIGCIRKLQNWSLTMIFDEYRRFAFPKARALDQQFIEMYDDKEIIGLANKKNWLPIQW